MLFESSYSKLTDICRFLKENNYRAAKQGVSELILERVDIDTSNEGLLAHIVAASLLKRIGKKLLESKNIYLQEFDIPQIVLFYKMVEAYPQVACSHAIANQYLASIAAGLKKVTIFDIGIGKGKQLEAMLASLPGMKCKCKDVHIIGLDPDEVNLMDVKALYGELGKKVPFNLKFTPICNIVEKFTGADWGYIRDCGEDHLLINSAYAMHHVLHPLNDNTPRLEIFKKLRALNPLLFTLLEPNSDHDTEDISLRLRNCWKHFGTVFNLIDQSSIGPEHKFLIKEKFFGREIKNIFSVSDYLRSERHEAIDTWMLRLTMAGFKPYEFRDLSISLPEHCEYKIDDGIVEMGYNSIPLVGVFAYKPEK